MKRFRRRRPVNRSEFDPEEVYYDFMGSEEAAELLSLSYNSFRELEPSLPQHAVTPARFVYPRRELSTWLQGR